MIDYEFGKGLAQVYSHDIGRLLRFIYMAYVEPKKPIPNAVIGIVDEVSTWKTLGINSKEQLDKLIYIVPPKH